jgi:Tol biopolymer transport system component
LAASAAIAQTVQQLDRVALPTAQVDVAVSPDGRFALVRAGAGVAGISFYRLGDGVRTAAFDTLSRPPDGSLGIVSSDSVAISPDSTRAVVVGSAVADSVAIFDTGGPVPERLRTFGLLTAAHDVAISPDNRFAVVRAGASSDGITFYRLNDAVRIGAFGTFTAPAGVDSVAISPDGSRTVVLGGAGTDSIRIFDTRGTSAVPRVTHNLPTAPHDLAISPDGRFAVVRAGASSLGGIVFLRLSDGAIQRFGASTSPPFAVTGSSSSDSVAVSPDSTRAVVLGGTGVDAVVLFDTSGSDPVEIARASLLSRPHDVAISADGRFAVVRAGVSPDGVSFFRLLDGVRIAAFQTLTAPPGASPGIATVDSLAVSPGANRVFAIGAAGAGGLMVFDTTRAVPVLRRQETLLSAGRDLEISPDGRFAAVRAGASNAALLFYRLGDGARVAAFNALSQPGPGLSDAVAVSSDGERVVMIGGSGGSGASGVETFAVNGGLLPLTVERVSVDSLGRQGNRGGGEVDLSGDGRYVAFDSFSDNLAPDDASSGGDIFVHDRVTGLTLQMNVDSAGNPGNGNSLKPGISGDGRRVAFQSQATNLVPGDTNGMTDVFVHDQVSGLTWRVNVDSAGEQANGQSFFEASISGDGRFAGFASLATNLVPGDTNDDLDAFVHDLETGVTERVSLGAGGVEANGGSGLPALSGDGRWAAFRSEATNLVPGDTNGTRDVFVRDRRAGTTERVSVATGGLQGNGVSDFPSISGDGRWVAFESEATNLAPGDTNGTRDVFVHDRQTGVTRRVSVDSQGQQGNGYSSDADLSPDGRFVAFRSEATNLVAGDTNDQGDIFLHDLQTGETMRVNVTPAGEQCTAGSAGARVSLHGRSVAFLSGAEALAPGDTNGWVDSFVASDLRTPPDGDADGVADRVEDGASNGGDGNGDGVRDADQAQVASLPNPVDGAWLTLVAPAGTRLEEVRAESYPLVFGAPSQVGFPFGFLRFELADLPAGGTAVVDLLLPSGRSIDSYWKFGFSPGNPTPHYYAFGFDGTTGAEILSDRVRLHLVDGQRGDGDLTADGRIRDPGGAGSSGLGPPPIPCVADSTTLCLSQGRFRVVATWRTPAGTSGVGQAEGLTGDTGYFWFFQQENVEVVLKVLDACAAFDRFWVFAAGLTNVAVDLIVTDTLAGVERIYRNPQRTAFQPIQDTAAFATCEAVVPVP